MSYSERINDPAFTRYIQNTHRVTWIFSSIIAIVAIVGFFIYGQTSTEMDNPQALYIGFGIGGMFLVIALFRSLGYRKGKTWDGVITGKDVKEKRVKKYTGDNDYYWDVYKVYNVFVQDEQGKNHTIRTERNDTVYKYYKVGDKVRYHGGLHTYEKFDKSHDSIVFCNACATLNDIQNEVCTRCKCPLLK
ncbi:MAG: hypothetical protein PHI40_08670 [Caldisericia bacterium]|nr:hypothetical protein [Caldisericia bacterium]MDD4615458.1 hypothetical protein [Caldisericia bacterium]